MKFFRIYLILCISIIGLQLYGQTSDSQKNVIKVVDFHSTHRCTTCNNIEANTKYTLETYFSKELTDGIITLDIINVDENEMMAEKYEAPGTSLFINVITNGNENIIDLTNFAFLNGNDREEFSKGLRQKLDAQLEKI